MFCIPKPAPRSIAHDSAVNDSRVSCVDFLYSSLSLVSGSSVLD